jgi:hypothetical protein
MSKAGLELLERLAKEITRAREDVASKWTEIANGAKFKNGAKATIKLKYRLKLIEESIRDLTDRVFDLAIEIEAKPYQRKKAKVEIQKLISLLEAKTAGLLESADEEFEGLPGVIFEKRMKVLVEYVRSRAAVSTRLLIKKTVSFEEMIAWFKRRVRTWPKGEPFPNIEVDRVAISAFFPGRSIVRDLFREARNQEVPHAWQKQGPRRHHIEQLINRTK